MASAFAHYRGLAALLAGVVVIAGCVSRRPPDIGGSPLVITAQLDRETYRPGDMVLCEVWLRNASDKTLGVSSPFASSGAGEPNLVFRRLNLDEESFLRRRPIDMEKTPAPSAPLDLPPGEAVSDRYAFVDLTESRGRFALQVEYVGVAVGEKARPVGQDEGPLIIGWVEYNVAGPVALQRGPGGLITEEEAIRVAGEFYGRSFRSGRGVLVETEPGAALVDWWITLERFPEDIREGEGPRIGYLVSPYGGFVRNESEPFGLDPDVYLEARSRAEGQQRRARPGVGVETTSPSFSEEE